VNATPASGPVLVLEDVSRVHGEGETEVVALSHASLTVARGELVAVMGPSGSGKSSLLNLAGGLDQATSGRVVVEGVDVSSLDAKGLAALRRRSIGFVFQDLNLIPSLTAAENIGLPLELDGWSVRRARGQALDALDRLKLRDLADRYPDQMSGGQQQRVAIARALAASPRLLVADEPTGQLDAETGLAVMALLRGVVESEGVTALVSTHDPVMMELADRVIHIADGQLTS
jgi:putative ABC transport system ATP-binding protein